MLQAQVAAGEMSPSLLAHHLPSLRRLSHRVRHPVLLAREPRLFCTKESCVKSASRVSVFMDRSVNPCDDFYRFACGGWVKDSFIPADRPEVTIYTQMEEDVQVTLKKLLEMEEASNEPAAIQQARAFYASCHDEDQLEDIGREPFDKLLAQVGKWPSLDSAWNDTDVELEELLLSLSRVGLEPIISIQIAPDPNDPSVNRIYVSEGKLGMGAESREIYLKGRHSREVRAYHKMLRQLLIELGVHSLDAESDVEEIVELESRLANITVCPCEGTKGYKSTSIEELEIMYPMFDWSAYINGLMHYGSAPPQVTRSEKIIITSPSFFQKLFPLLETTPTRVMANYLMSSLHSHMKHLTSRFRQILLDFQKELKGSKSQRTRWQECVALTDALFPEVTSRLFVQSAFGPDERAYLEEIVGNIRIAFLDILRQAEWLGPDSKAAAIEKARSLKARVGYPDNILEDEFLENAYAEYNMSKETFFQNMLRLTYLRNLAQVNRLRQPAEKNSLFSATQVKAYYNPKANEIVFPAGFIQPPVYDSVYSRSMNYGGIGSVIGREMTHGFDEVGREYDKAGNPQRWWSKDDLNDYEEQTECIVDQYSCFRWKPAQMNIDGLRTRIENIADNGGLRQSYRAYRRWVQENGLEERLLPGLNLTHNQIFFLSFAQLWCTNDRDEYKIEKVKSHAFAPSPYRVIGTLQNSEDFATAFNCPLGSRMNPEKKCRVW
ncbi:neprilysin-4-like [Pomacea canaliculata]|uniref:neprilysin-4-like n=1 Tax=Pomacea canaliculata TaxID=400727 RepID=UPI000D73F26E|nr:neprilysin-4-like [Pomacea canaliculata]